MVWPPRVGEALPRGQDASYEQPKWSEWILAPRGHGLEWGGATAMAVTVWHLAHDGAAPRLVTAYPRPYTG